MPEVLAFAAEFKLVGRGKTGVYGRLKMEMWRETVGYLDAAGDDERRMTGYVLEQEKREGEEKRRVGEWEGGGKGGKSKL